MDKHQLIMWECIIHRMYQCISYSRSPVFLPKGMIFDIVSIRNYTSHGLHILS